MQLQPFPADNPTTPQPSLSCPPFIHPYNHDSTALRVESKNDSDTTIPHPIFSNHNSTMRKRIREAVAECEAYARPARTTRSLRAPLRHDFDARAFTRALYAGGQNHAGPANVLSCDSRLSGLGPSLHRQLRFASEQRRVAPVGLRPLSQAEPMVAGEAGGRSQA